MYILMLLLFKKSNSIMRLLWHNLTAIVVGAVIISRVVRTSAAHQRRSTMSKS